MCKNMKWAHLPVAGGLYDQHPKFLEDMMELMNLDTLQKNRDHARQQAEAKRKSKR